MHAEAATAALVTRLRAGDKQAFEKIFSTYYPDLYRFARRQLRDPSDAEDVIQDVFLRIWRDRERLIVERSLRAFLLVAVRNRVVDRVRRRKMERAWISPLPECGFGISEESANGLGQATAAEADPAATAELHDAVRRAVAALPDRCQATYVLCREHGLSYAEAAEVMAVTPGTVKTQMGRALASLRRALEPFLAPAVLALFIATVFVGGVLGWLRRHGNAPTAPAVPMREIAAAPGERVRLRLDDGTRVWLAPGSRLSAPPRFSHDAREVDVAGRAYFEVAHDLDRPFRVHAGTVLTQVLGTEFEVRAERGAAPARVVVRSGRVAVRSAAGSRAAARVLGENQQATVDSTGTMHVETSIDAESLLAWTEGRLVFRRAPLAEVAAELEPWYAVEIELADAVLGARRITADFAEESLDSVLQIIAELADARVERNGSQIELTARR